MPPHLDTVPHDLRWYRWYHQMCSTIYIWYGYIYIHITRIWAPIDTPQIPPQTPDVVSHGCQDQHRIHTIWIGTQRRTTRYMVHMTWDIVSHDLRWYRWYHQMCSTIYIWYGYTHTYTHHQDMSAPRYTPDTTTDPDVVSHGCQDQQHRIHTIWIGTHRRTTRYMVHMTWDMVSHDLRWWYRWYHQMCSTIYIWYGYTHIHITRIWAPIHHTTCWCLVLTHLRPTVAWHRYSVCHPTPDMVPQDLRWWYDGITRCAVPFTYGTDTYTYTSPGYEHT